MEIPSVSYYKTNHAKLTFGRPLKIQSFVSAGTATNLATVDSHCLLTGDKIILFASDSGNESKHAIADGQAYNITKISPTAFSVPLDTSNCAITEGVCVVPEDLSLFSFNAVASAVASTENSTIVGRTTLSATASSYYIEVEGETIEDFDGLEASRFLFAEGIISNALIKSVSKNPLPENGCCDDAPFFSNKKLKKSLLIDKLPVTGQTMRWRTEKSPPIAQIVTAIDIGTSTVMLSIYGEKGKYYFEVIQNVISTQESSVVVTGEWTV
jgi:hypothetical protein